MTKNTNVPKRLFLYMNYHAAFELLATKRLFFSTFESYNDPFEIMPQSSFTNILSNKSTVDIQRDINKYLDDHPDEFTSGELQGIGALSAASGGVLGLLGFSFLPVAGLIALGLGIYTAGVETENKEKKRSHEEKKKIQEETEKKEGLKHFLDLCKNYLRGIRVCCMSEKKDDILMWSHYARKHTGMVFEFDTTDSCWKDVGCDFLKVNYTLERAIIPANSEKRDIDIVDDLISRKYVTWKYEKEWRVVKRNCDNIFSLKLPSNALKGVYLGVRVTQENTSIINDIIKIQFKDTKLYKAKLDENKYELRFDPVKTNAQ